MRQAALLNRRAGSHAAARGIHCVGVLLLKRLAILSIAAASFIPGAGCIELQLLLGTLTEVGGDSGTGGGSDSGNGNGGSGDGGNSSVPRVTLTASNVTPELDETVTLRCTVDPGDSGGVTYSFSPDARLTVDALRGTAQFVVQSSDLGVAFSFTCAAANAQGDGPPSASVLVTPTDTQQPE